MNAALTLWLLNRVVGWNRPLMVAHLVDRFDVKLGRRTSAHQGGDGSAAARIVRCPGEDELTCLELSVNAKEEGAPGELMHEGGALSRGAISAFDEYFVPTPLKCLGDPNSAFWQQCASPAGKERLREIANHWAARFPDGFKPDEAKKKVGRNFGEVQMNLADDALGYYQLRRWRWRPSGCSEHSDRIQPGRHGRAVPRLSRRACRGARVPVHPQHHHRPVAEPGLARGLRS